MCIRDSSGICVSDDLHKTSLFLGDQGFAVSAGDVLAYFHRCCGSLGIFLGDADGSDLRAGVDAGRNDSKIHVRSMSRDLFRCRDPLCTCHVSQLDAFYDIADGVDAGSAGLSVDVGFDEASLHGDTQVMSSLCRSFQVFGRKCRRVFRDISKFLRIQEQSRSVWLSAHCAKHVLR